MLLLGTGIFGGLGAMARFYLSQKLKWGGGAFPYATLLINITGSAMLGLLYGMHEMEWISDWVWQLIGVGFVGAYTTFSTFSYELFTLVQQKRGLAAASYLTFTVIGGVLIAFLCSALLNFLN